MLIERRSAAGGKAGIDRGSGSIGRAAIKGAIMGYFAVVVLVGTILLLAGAGLGWALGVGAFVGIWGGPGWGGMVAAQREADRLAEEERQAKAGTGIRTSPVGERALGPGPFRPKRQ